MTRKQVGSQAIKDLERFAGEVFDDLAKGVTGAVGATLKLGWIFLHFHPGKCVLFGIVSSWLLWVYHSWLHSTVVSWLTNQVVSSWLAGLVYPHMEMLVTIFIPAVVFLIVAFPVMRERQKWANLFQTVELKNKDGQFPELVDSNSSASGLQTVVFWPRGLSSKHFERVQQELGLAMRREIVGIEDNVESGNVIMRLNASPLKGLVSLQKLLNKAGAIGDCDVVLGLATDGPVKRNLSKLPHLMIAGATGTGKSSILRALIYQLLKFSKNTEIMLIDSKDLDFAAVKRAPQVTYITEDAESYNAIEAAVSDMKRRQQMLSGLGFQNFEEALKKDKCPFKRRILIIDELAELAKIRKSDPEHNQLAKKALDQIERLSSLGRASGIYLIVATQRPDKSVLPGTIKVNFPAKLCFGVPNHADSLAVLQNKGAAELPHIPGRAVYQEGARETIIQAPFVQAQDLLEVASVRLDSKSQSNREHVARVRSKVDVARNLSGVGQ